MIWSRRLDVPACGRRRAAAACRVVFGGAHLQASSGAGVSPRPVSLLSFFSASVLLTTSWSSCSSLSLPSILFSRFGSRLAGLEQLAERLDLLDDLLGLEVVDRG